MTRTTHTIHDDNVDVLARAIADLGMIVALIGLAITIAVTGLTIVTALVAR